MCTKFIPNNTDLTIHLIGFDLSESVGVSAHSENGSEALGKTGMAKDDTTPGNEKAIGTMYDRREEEKKRILSQTKENSDSIEKFERYVATCLNCHNCRIACPVCYCRECVFLTDVFAHDPHVLLRRAEKRGMIKLPTDTTMFHMTRMAHMAHACVACGHCSSVCPSNIPVAELFIKVGDEVQALYDYEPGRDVNEPMPLLVYDEKSSE
jgi:formate dehydrogenase subunit beta